MALITCPECGKEISDKAKCCIHCGYPLEEEAQKQPELPEEDRYWEVPFSEKDCLKDENGIAGPEPNELSGIREITCPSCGRPISAKAAVCPGCGYQINRKAEGISWRDVASIIVAAMFLLPILMTFLQNR